MPTAAPVLLGAAEIGRHYHRFPYATLVVEGCYEEAGDQGRFQVAAGDMLLHPAFSAHCDRVGRAPTYVLDVPLPFDGRVWPGLAHLPDPDLLLKLARRDLREAAALVAEVVVAVPADRGDPADRLADALTEDPSLAIGEWAARSGFSREWLSRRFQRIYGIDAALYRSEARARRAWSKIVDTDAPLAEVALDCGFADQAHMTRAVSRLTRRPPRSWRSRPSWAPVTSVQESGSAAG